MRSKVQRRAERRAVLRDAFRSAVMRHWEAKSQGAHASDIERLAQEVWRLQSELAAAEKGA
jgi:hypothetical protein